MTRLAKLGCSFPPNT